MEIAPHTPLSSANAEDPVRRSFSVLLLPSRMLGRPVPATPRLRRGFRCLARRSFSGGGKPGDDSYCGLRILYVRHFGMRRLGRRPGIHTHGRSYAADLGENGSGIFLIIRNSRLHDFRQSEVICPWVDAPQGILLKRFKQGANEFAGHRSLSRWNRITCRVQKSRRVKSRAKPTIPGRHH
jgi:hypothetical protein